MRIRKVFGGMQVLLLTDDVENRRKAGELGIQAISTQVVLKTPAASGSSVRAGSRGKA